jgi:hypothetical protein
VSAAGRTADGRTADGVPFSISIRYADSQSDPAAGYFCLTARPGETRQLVVSAVNESDAGILLYAESADACADPDGALVYAAGDAALDGGYIDARYRMAANLEAPAQPLALEPGETATVRIIARVPGLADSEFLGAVRFYTLSVGEAESDGRQAAGGVAIKNARTIPVRISTGEPAAAGGINAGARFDAAGRFGVTVSNGRPALTVLDQLSLEVTNAAGESVAWRSLSPVRLPPMTYFRAALDWTGRAAPGDYTLTAAWRSGDSVERAVRTFRVDEAQAAALSSRSAPDPGGYVSLTVILAVGSLLTVVVVWFLLWSRRNERRSALPRA